MTKPLLDTAIDARAEDSMAMSAADTTTSPGDLAGAARVMWRREPGVHGPLRTRVMTELTDVRLELEALERRSHRSARSLEDERTLRECERRLARLRLHWRSA